MLVNRKNIKKICEVKSSGWSGQGKIIFNCFSLMFPCSRIEEVSVRRTMKMAQPVQLRPGQCVNNSIVKIFSKAVHI